MGKYGNAGGDDTVRRGASADPPAPPDPAKRYSRKPLDAKVDPGLAAKLFALEAEYYQDITLPSTGAPGTSRLIVDVLDTLSIGAGTPIPEDTSDRISLYTESLVVTQFKAKSLVLACNTISGVVAAKLAPSISVSPAAKKKFDAPNKDGAGSKGAPGDKAGDILLLVESIDEKNPGAFPLLDARGGGGQDGQDSLADAGGAPGYGGSGGNVTVVYGSPVKRAILVIENALDSLDGPNARLILSALKALPDQGMKLPSGKSLGELLSDKDPLDPFLQAMRDLFISPPEKPLDAATFRKDLTLVTDTLAGCIDTLKLHIESVERDLIYPKILNKAGETGLYGSGPKGASSEKPSGAEPADGKIVVKAVADLSELPWASADGIDCRTLVSDMQAAMLLQKAKMAYFYGDVSEGATAKETAEAAKILLDRLVSRLSFVGKMTAPDDKDDPTAAFPRLQSVFNEATAYQTQFDHGLDYYGHLYGEVPLLTLEKYRETVDSLSKNFADLEKEYAQYFTYLTENTAEMFQLSSAGRKLVAVNDQLEKDQNVLREMAGRTAYDISSLTDSLSLKKDKLDQAITNFQGDVNKYFNVDFKALLSGLSTIAFAPESAAMWATQASSWLYNGFTTIPDDTGEAINKDYIVHKVASVEATVKGISEGFKQLNDGLFQADDPGANKLIAAQADLRKFLDDFANKFGDEVQGIKKGFDDYVSTVVDRNNKILGYNAAISLLLKKKKQVADNQARQQDVETQMANDVSPALPALTATMSVFYHATRDQLMELLYLMCRAYQFRALDNTNLIAKYMNEKALTPASMTQSKISSLYADSDVTGRLQSGIAWDWYQAQERMGQYEVTEFPAQDDAWGALYTFSDPGTLETFKQVRTLANKTQVHSVSLTVPTVFATGVTDSALARMSDIRLTNVRAWLDGVGITGADANALLLMDIVHTGHESLVDPSGKLFSFTHASVTKPFSYYPAKLPQDPSVFPKDAIFTRSVIDNGGDHPTYALIGPFTTWEVRLTNFYTAKVGILAELKKLAGAYQGLQGKDVTCQYPDHSPILGKVGKVAVAGGVLTLEIVNLIDRTIETLTVDGRRVTSEKVLKGAEVANPDDAISFSSDAPGPKVDFSKFTAIRLEFCGRGRGFST